MPNTNSHKKNEKYAKSGADQEILEREVPSYKLTKIFKPPLTNNQSANVIEK